MATFNSAVDASGRPVVRCFVKGAAPAVTARTASALAAGATVPWDAEQSRRAQEHAERMGAARRGGRLTVLACDSGVRNMSQGAYSGAPWLPPGPHRCDVTGRSGPRRAAGDRGTP